jgi:hypothetical protein
MSLPVHKIHAILSHDMITQLRFVGHLAGKLRGRGSAGRGSEVMAVGSIINASKDMEMLTVKILDWIRFYQDAHLLKSSLFNLYGAIVPARGTEKNVRED